MVTRTIKPSAREAMLWHGDPGTYELSSSSPATLPSGVIAGQFIFRGLPERQRYELDVYGTPAVVLAPRGPALGPGSGSGRAGQTWKEIRVHLA